MDEFIKNQLDKHHIPGIAACIVKNDKIEWSNAYGWADVENKVSMSIDAIMNIGSISKTITATAIMQLWEKDKLKLDTDINEYLPISVRNPSFPDVPITIRNLLTHTSSIRDGSAYDDSYSRGDPKISLKHWVTNYITKDGNLYNEKENFQSWKPGSKSKYTNVGFGVLGYIVEEVSKMPFNKYCKEHILTPLKMNNTGWFLHEIDTTNHVIPYTYKDLPQKGQVLSLKKNVAHGFYSFPNYPDGLLRTSVEELSHFLIAIINGGVYGDKQILTKSTIDKMLTLQIDGNNSQGLCWYKIEFKLLWGHGGADPGINTEMFFNPETKIGVIVFKNNDQGWLFEIVQKLYLSAIDSEK